MGYEPVKNIRKSFPNKESIFLPLLPLLPHLPLWCTSTDWPSFREALPNCSSSRASKYIPYPPKPWNKLIRQQPLKAPATFRSNSFQWTRKRSGSWPWKKHYPNPITRINCRSAESSPNLFVNIPTPEKWVLTSSVESPFPEPCSSSCKHDALFAHRMTDTCEL